MHKHRHECRNNVSTLFPVSDLPCVLLASNANFSSDLLSPGWDTGTPFLTHTSIPPSPIFLIKETVNSRIKLFTGKLMHQYAQQCSHLLIIAHDKMTSDHGHG